MAKELEKNQESTKAVVVQESSAVVRQVAAPAAPPARKESAEIVVTGIAGNERAASELRRLIASCQDLELRLLLTSAQCERAELRVQELESYTKALETRLSAQARQDLEFARLQVQRDEALARIEILGERMKGVEAERLGVLRAFEELKLSLVVRAESDRSEGAAIERRLKALEQHVRHITDQREQMRDELNKSLLVQGRLNQEIESLRSERDRLRDQIRISAQHSYRITETLEVTRAAGGSEELDALERQQRSYQAQLELISREIAAVQVKLDSRRSEHSELVIRRTERVSESASTSAALPESLSGSSGSSSS